MIPAKTHYRRLIDAFALTAAAPPDAALRDFFAADAAINEVHPFNLCTGPEAFLARVLAPLRASFAGLHRRTDLVMGGRFEGADWVSSTGCFVGTFERDWLGIRATTGSPGCVMASSTASRRAGQWKATSTSTCPD